MLLIVWLLWVRFVNLPSGKFNVLTFVGTSVDSAAGTQSQNFTVTYSDTSTQTLTFSLSDWTAPENYPNEYAVHHYRTATP